MVVLFYAEWCLSCRSMTPIYETLSEEFTDSIFYKVHIEDNEETAESQKIKALPTFIFYRKAEKVKS